MEHNEALANPELRQVDQDLTLPCTDQLLNGRYLAKRRSLGKVTLLQRHFLKKADSSRRFGDHSVHYRLHFLLLFLGHTFLLSWGSHHR